MASAIGVAPAATIIVHPDPKGDLAELRVARHGVPSLLGQPVIRLRRLSTHALDAGLENGLDGLGLGAPIPEGAKLDRELLRGPALWAEADAPASVLLLFRAGRLIAQIVIAVRVDEDLLVVRVLLRDEEEDLLLQRALGLAREVDESVADAPALGKSRGGDVVLLAIDEDPVLPLVLEEDIEAVR